MNDEPSYRALTLRLPPELHAQLAEAAAAHERSWGGEVRAVLEEHLAREQKTIDSEAS